MPLSQWERRRILSQALINFDLVFIQYLLEETDFNGYPKTDFNEVEGKTALEFLLQHLADIKPGSIKLAEIKKFISVFTFLARLKNKCNLEPLIDFNKSGNLLGLLKRSSALGRGLSQPDLSACMKIYFPEIKAALYKEIFSYTPQPTAELIVDYFYDDERILFNFSQALEFLLLDILLNVYDSQGRLALQLALQDPGIEMILAPPPHAFLLSFHSILKYYPCSVKTFSRLLTCIPTSPSDHYYFTALSHYLESSHVDSRPPYYVEGLIENYKQFENRGARLLEDKEGNSLSLPALEEWRNVYRQQRAQERASYRSTTADRLRTEPACFIYQETRYKELIWFYTLKTPYFLIMKKRVPPYLLSESDHRILKIRIIEELKTRHFPQQRLSTALQTSYLKLDNRYASNIVLDSKIFFIQLLESIQEPERKKMEEIITYIDTHFFDFPNAFTLQCALKLLWKATKDLTHPSKNPIEIAAATQKRKEALIKGLIQAYEQAKDDFDFYLNALYLMALALNKAHPDIDLPTRIEAPVLLNLWTGEYLLELVGNKEVQRGILLQWNRKEGEYMTHIIEFKNEVETHLDERLKEAYSDLGHAERGSLIKAALENQPSVHELLTSLIQRIKAAPTECDALDSEAYRAVLQKIQVSAENVYQVRDDKTMDTQTFEEDYAWLQQEVNLDSLFELRKLERKIREQASQPLFEKLLAFIEASYSKPSELDKALLVCRHFEALLSQYLPEYPLEEKISKESHPDFWLRALIRGCLLSPDKLPTIVAACAKIQENYNCLNGLQAIEEKEDEAIFLYRQACLSEFHNQPAETPLQEIYTLSYSLVEYRLRPTIESYKKLLASSALPREHLEKSVALILADETNSLDDSRDKIIQLETFIQKYFRPTETQSEKLFLRPYLRWRMKQLPIQDEGLHQFIPQLEEEYYTLLAAIRNQSAFENSALIAIQNYINTTASPEKKKMLNCSLWLAQIKTAYPEQAHFQEFAQNKFQRLQPLLENHKDPFLARLLLDLIISLGLRPIYRRVTYGKFFPTNSEMFLQDVLKTQTKQSPVIKPRPY